MKIIWEKDFHLRFYEVGQDGHVSLPNLMNFFQDAASEHAAHLGVGIPKLVSQGFSWFVTRFHVRVQRYPVYGETIRIRTWPKSKKRFFALRDFEMYVGDEQIAAGSTVWCLIDLKSKSPMNVNETLPGLPENPCDALVTSFPRINLPESMSLKRDLSPRDSEIDMNGHVNNAVYVSWALENLPRSRVRGKMITEMTAFFKHEIGDGQQVLSRATFNEAECPLESVHCLSEKASAVEVLRMKVRWESGKG